ncbi:BTAD domain-containing putative transcriptional regulator [Streptomyces sp. NPDC046324]|uniref:BTAD domain-containing putative transcriptional regulator n=1 Tax=Streptomyces sp. NPDC046324 TaxID=3154915 RepID=UPI00340AF062
MEFRILGPLEVLMDGRPVSLGGAKQRATLGFLLLQMNRVVAVSELQDALWAFDEAPPTARKVLQNAVWGLRGLFSASDPSHEAAAVVTQAPGYMLRVAPEQVDLHRFHRKVEQGRAHLAAGTTEQAADLLGDALALWRGPALADLVETGIAWPGLTALQSAKLDVMEDYFEAQLGCGRHHDVLADLTAIVADEPFRERSCGQFMLALYRCGRQVEALDAYSRLRTALAQDLGLEPSRELQSLQRAILTHDPSLTPEQPSRRGEPATEPHASLVDRPRAVPVPGAPAHLTATDAVAAFTADATSDTGGPALPLPADTSAPGGTTASPARLPQRIRPERRHMSLVLIRSRFGEQTGQLRPAQIDDALENVAALVAEKAEQFGGQLALAIGPLSLLAFGLADAGAEGCEERAVRAALAVRDHLLATPGHHADRTALPAPVPEVSLAVATGEALVRSPSGDAAAPSVFGSLVERCQTLLSTTSGGQIAVCDRTRRPTAAVVAYRPGPGTADDDWLLEGIRGDGPATPGPGSIAGHEAELAMVQGLSDWTRRRVTTHLVTVLGEPGIGKTRFLDEFRGDLADGRAEPPQWLMTRVPRSADNDAVTVMTSMVSTLCGISPQDSPAAVYGRLSAALDQWVDPAPERSWLSARLSMLYGLKSTHHVEDAMRDVFQACRRLLTHVAVRTPLVLALDDVHRADDDVLDFVEALADLPASVPLFVIVTARPELLRRRPEWGAGSSHTTTVTLTAPRSTGRIPDALPYGPAQGTGRVRDLFSAGRPGDRPLRGPATDSFIRGVVSKIPAGVACPGDAPLAFGDTPGNGPTVR